MTHVGVILGKSLRSVMGNKKANILWVIIGFLIVIVFFLPIVSSDYQKYAAGLIQSHPYLAPFIIILFRFIAVVLAPLPGAPISFASMAVLPWYEAWSWNFIGAELGAITAFLIARYFREPAVARFAPLERVHQWQERVSKTKQFWGFVGLRFVSLVAFDFVSYAAGLTKLSFLAFITATLLIDIPAGFLFFYFGGLAVKYSIFIFAVFVVIFMIVALVWSRLLNKKEV